MWPVIFDFGEISIFGFEFHPVINSYGFMLMLAFYSCYFFLNKDLKRLGYDAKLSADIVFAAAIGGILGSKIYYLLENFDRDGFQWCWISVSRWTDGWNLSCNICN